MNKIKVGYNCKACAVFCWLYNKNSYGIPIVPDCSFGEYLKIEDGKIIKCNLCELTYGKVLPWKAHKKAERIIKC